jgi:hypothetical protein
MQVGRLIAIAALVVIAAAGFCVFDTDHRASGDLCISFLAIMMAPLLPFPWGPKGRILPTGAPAYIPYSPELPAPPPKA